jgi:TolB protein
VTLPGPRSLLIALAVAVLAAAAACGGDGPPQPRVLFYSDRDGDDDIYMMELDGSGVIQLTDEPGRDYEGDITPDGGTIVFASERATEGHGQLFLMDADGADVRRLTFSGEGGRRVTDDYPHWSPDGRRIVFQRTAVSEEGVDADVWLIDPGTGEETQLTDTPSDWDSTPAFSADGGGVIFESNREGGFDVYRLDLATMELTRLTGDEGDDSGGKVSPGGEQLLFSSDREGDLEVYLAGSDGADPRPLTDNEARDRYPHWSPDGRLILFESDRDGNREIYLMNADGSGQRRITSDPGKDADPHWVLPR